jgi:hopanoid-associated phosphorylase
MLRARGDELLVVALCGLRFEAGIAAAPGVMAMCEPGLGQAAARFDALLASGEIACGGIISFGCAGGLDPALKPGDCVLAESVLTADGPERTDAGWLRALHAALPSASIGMLAAASQPVTDSAAKAQLWQQSGALTLDMESHMASLIARRHQLPFAALRVVADPAGLSLPACALAGMRGDGSVAVMPVLRSLVAGPSQLPALAQLAAGAHAARRALRSARALAGPRFALPAR